MGTASLETQFVSVERVAEYTRLPCEDPDDATENHENWPHSQEICLEGVTLRYKFFRDLVLRGVSLAIEPREKVAICGRTGCGKSSLFGALCRLYPTSQGVIKVGGKDITFISTRALRRQVRVVSQDAFLLSGSIRANLTTAVESSVSDDTLEKCLEMVGMWEKVKSLGGLDFLVDEGGSNFSVGERQLLTLARVLVPSDGCASPAQWTPPPFLLCDEATANVDLLSDEKVHDVVLKLDSTVLMICHRLHHIARFNKVVVLDKGKVAESGPPKQLAEDPQSMLAKLQQQAGVLAGGSS